MHTLIFPNPGHFHAALTLRKSDPRLNDDIYVYAEKGRELDSFLELVEAFNTRADRPTRWKPHVDTGPGGFERLMAERKGDIVVLAGKTDRKMSEIRSLREAGYHVLADKPWVIDEAGLDDLHAAMNPVQAGPPLVMDIMTERHEVALILLRALLGSPKVFGGFQDVEADSPGGFSLEVETTHQLYKTVNDQVLVRYPWYFDVKVQGDGIVDVPTHLVDQVQWLLGDHTYQYDQDISLDWAKRWNTDLDGSSFERITRIPPFPVEVAPFVREGVLGYPCNGAIGFHIQGIPVRVQSLWGLSTVPAADDYRLVCRGKRCDILLEHGAHADSGRKLVVTPHAGEEAGVLAALQMIVASWQTDYAGTALIEQDGEWEIVVPEHWLIGHEEHFFMVMEEFLGYLEQGVWPENLAPNIITKYTLLAKASALADSTLA